MRKNHLSVTASTVENKASYRRPELSWATALRRGVVDGTHRFRKFNVGGAVPRKSDAIPPHEFAPSTNATESVPFERMAGFNDKADWHSPAPSNAGMSAADLDLVVLYSGRTFY